MAEHVSEQSKLFMCIPMWFPATRSVILDRAIHVIFITTCSSAVWHRLDLAPLKMIFANLHINTFPIIFSFSNRLSQIYKYISEQNFKVFVVIELTFRWQRSSEEVDQTFKINTVRNLQLTTVHLLQSSPFHTKVGKRSQKTFYVHTHVVSSN